MSERKVASYLALARDDLRVAKKLAPDHPRHAAFHIEQAADKLLKAVLTVEKIPFATTHHQLGVLAALLPPDHLWRADLTAFDRYSKFATIVRYPTPTGGMPPQPDRADLEEAWQKISLLLPEIAEWCDERARP